MVETLTIAPLPRSIMPGTKAAVRVNGATTLNSSTAWTSSIGISWLAPEREDPCVVDEHVDLPCGLRELPGAIRCGEVGGDEACLSAGGLDRVYDLSATRLVAAGHDHLGVGAAELLGRRPTDA